MEAEKDWNNLTAAQRMIRTPIAGLTSTPSAVMITLVTDPHVLNLSVEENGAVIYPDARHDPLRAPLGLAMGRDHYLRTDCFGAITMIRITGVYDKPSVRDGIGPGGASLAEGVYEGAGTSQCMRMAKGIGSKHGAPHRART